MDTTVLNIYDKLKLFKYYFKQNFILNTIIQL